MNLTALIPLYDEVVIRGDFYVNLLDRDTRQMTTLISSLRSLNSAAHNDVPTCFHSSINPSLLDFVVSSGQFSSGLSDNDSIYI